MATTSYAAILTERNLNGRELTPQNNSSPKYQIKNLNFWYGAHQALFNIDLSIPERSVTALIGPSGCGKSTFLNMITGLDEPDSGKVLINNKSLNISNSSNFLKNDIGIIFQDHYLLNELNIKYIKSIDGIRICKSNEPLLYNEFNRLSVGALNKRLPEYVWNLSESQSRILMESLFASLASSVKRSPHCHWKCRHRHIVNSEWSKRIHYGVDNCWG